MKNRNNKTIYEAVGFIEALIAILLVGVSSLVLLQIAINTLNNAIQNEAIDHMTQYAVEGSEMVQDLYNKYKMDLIHNPDLEDEEEIERDFPKIDPEGRNCFVINKREEEGQFEVFFSRDPQTNEFIRFRRDERESYRQEALIDLQRFPTQLSEFDRISLVNISDQFFRIVCLEGDIDDGRDFVIARIIVGQRYFSEDLFDGELYGNFVRDYEYITIIHL